MNNISSIGHCILKSPTEIGSRDTLPFLSPEFDYELQGIEDPRIVKIEDTFFLTYTAYDGKNALGALATSKDFGTFTKEGIITPKMTYQEFELAMKRCKTSNDKSLRFVNVLSRSTGDETSKHLFVWDKDVIFFPKKIQGKFAFLHRLYPDIQIAYFNEIEELDSEYWEHYVCQMGENTVLSSVMPFEGSYLGGGCPPIETEQGWLMIYHGVEDTPQGYIYHAGAALLDLEDPTKVIGRLKTPLISPEHTWEKLGKVNNVVFPTGTIVRDDTLYIYYGAADSMIGVASVNLSALITEILDSHL